MASAHWDWWRCYSIQIKVSLSRDTSRGEREPKLETYSGGTGDGCPNRVSHNASNNRAHKSSHCLTVTQSSSSSVWLVGNAAVEGRDGGSCLHWQSLCSDKLSQAINIRNSGRNRYPKAPSDERTANETIEWVCQQQRTERLDEIQDAIGLLPVMAINTDREYKVCHRHQQNIRVSDGAHWKSRLFSILDLKESNSPGAN